MEVSFYAPIELQRITVGVKGMNKCRFLEKFRIPLVTGNGGDFMESERCRLGNEIPLDGCVENCPDFEPVK